jgi:membrane-anchored glycerophosphoryl diester phosphodiesterase (GDPDase)
MNERAGIVAALKHQPLVLALVVMNLALLGFLYYEGVAAHNERSEQAKVLAESRSDLAELLVSCRAGKP